MQKLMDIFFYDAENQNCLDELKTLERLILIALDTHGNTPMNQRELAKICGTTRRSINRVLHDLIDKKLIKKSELIDRLHIYEVDMNEIASKVLVN